MRPRAAVLYLAIALVTGSSPTVLRAESTSDAVEERLRRLEATVAALQRENAELRREVGAPVRPIEPTRSGAMIVPGGHEAKLVIGGFIQLQTEFGDQGDERFTGVNDRFYIRRARLYLAGAFAEHFDFKIEGEFGANTITPTTGLKAAGNEIYVGWNRFPEAIVRIGQLKPAFGGEQLLPETKSPTVERYLGSDRLTDPRQLGVGAAGDFLNQRLSYLVVIGNGNGPNTSANDNNKFMQTARVAAVAFDRTDVGRLQMGINAMHSDDGAVSRPGFGLRSVAVGPADGVFAGRRTGTGADASWHSGLLSVSAELLRVHFEPRDRVPCPSYTGQGWELMTTYFVIPQTLQAVVRRESFDPNRSVMGDQTNNWIVGLNYLVRGEDVRLVVDYLFGHDAYVPNDHGRLLTRLQVVF